MVESRQDREQPKELNLGEVSFGKESHQAVTPQVIFVEDPCENGQCPTVYKDPNGDFLIQGFIVSPDDIHGLSIPNGESLVRLPRGFIEAFIASQNKPD